MKDWKMKDSERNDILHNVLCINLIYLCYYIFYDSRRWLGTFLFTALGPTQPPTQWLPGSPSLGVKRPGCEADHLPPSSAEVKERVELYLHSPNTPLWRGDQLKLRDNFITFCNIRYIILIRQYENSHTFRFTGSSSHRVLFNRSEI
jgi:hypothetical protein